MDIQYEFIGWCNEGKHDKVWICILLRGDAYTGTYATVWGRRGKKLQYKILESVSYWADVEKLISSKRKKGYITVDRDKLDQVYPEFKDDLEKTTVWALLGA